MHSCPVPKCTDVDRNPTMIVDTDPMCTFHVGRVRSACGELVGLYRQLGDALEPGATGRGEVVRVSRTPAIPLNLAARSLQDDMLGVTRRAVIGYHLRRDYPMSVVLNGLEPTVLGRTATFVARHLDMILSDEARVGVDLLHIKTTARNVLGLTKLVHKLNAPCPECDSLGLRRDDGNEWVRCIVCGLAFDWDQHGLLVRILVAANPEAAEHRRPAKRDRQRCVAVAPRSTLTCRMEAPHGCSHLTYSDGYRDWETWR